MWPYKKKQRCLFTLRDSVFKGDFPVQYEGEIIEDLDKDGVYKIKMFEAGTGTYFVYKRRVVLI